MPQMMPMMWSLMLMFTMHMFFFLLSFMYFLQMNLTPPSYKKKINFLYWNWKW